MSCCGGNNKKRRIKEVGETGSAENKGNRRIIPLALIIASALILYFFLR